MAAGVTAKAQAAFFDQSMDLIQQRGNTLHLIDNNPITLHDGGNQFPEQRRISQQIKKQRFIQQVQA